MTHKRVHNRTLLAVPALLIMEDNTTIPVKTVDLSVDGIGITGLSRILDKKDYRIEVRTDREDHVARFGARLVHQEKASAGFQITVADGVSLKNIIQICYQHCTEKPH